MTRHLFCDDPDVHGCGRRDGQRAAAAVERLNEIVTRILSALHRAHADGCDLRRTGAFKIFVHPRIAYEMKIGFRAKEDFEGARHPADMLIPDAIGHISGFDICVDHKLYEDGIVIRYEVIA